MTEKLRKDALEWLKKSGFPLEMAAAKALQKMYFEVRQSATYVDPETNKGREIDVIATDFDWLGAVDIAFILECKSSKNPWVVLCSDTALDNYNRLSLFALVSESARKYLTPRLNKIGSWEFIDRRGDSGYGFRQLLSERTDAAYSAAINVLKACVDLIKESESKSYKPASCYFPVIVIDTPLFECRLMPDGELELKQVQQSEFLFTAHIPKAVGCCIRVITKEHLDVWAGEARKIADVLRQDLICFENEISARFKGIFSEEKKEEEF